MPIKTEELRLDTIGQLDPRMEKLFQSHIQRICADCRNRPTDKTVRKLVFQFDVEPVVDPETGECEQVNLTVEAQSKVPNWRTRTFPMAITGKGLEFNAHTPDALDQSNLFDDGANKPE